MVITYYSRLKAWSDYLLYVYENFSCSMRFGQLKDCLKLHSNGSAQSSSKEEEDRENERGKKGGREKRERE